MKLAGILLALLICVSPAYAGTFVVSGPSTAAVGDTITVTAVVTQASGDSLRAIASYLAWDTSIATYIDWTIGDCANVVLDACEASDHIEIDGASSGPCNIWSSPCNMYTMRFALVGPGVLHLTPKNDVGCTPLCTPCNNCVEGRNCLNHSVSMSCTGLSCTVSDLE